MINIPCPNCGCNFLEATNLVGERVEIQICSCNDGSGEYEVIITVNGSKSHEKFQCAVKEIENCLKSRFHINMNTIKYECCN